MPCVASLSLRRYGLSCLSSTASLFLGKRQAARFCSPVHPIRRAHRPQTACFTGKFDLMTTAEYDDELNKAMDALSSLISRKQRGDGRTYATAYDYMQVYLEVSFPCQSFSSWVICRESLLELIMCHAFHSLMLVQRLGLDTKLDQLNVVHVAGTKGKVVLVTLHLTEANSNSLDPTIVQGLLASPICM